MTDPTPADLRRWADDFEAEETAQIAAGRGWDAKACELQAAALRREADEAEARDARRPR